jgi:hypothetical protein
VVVRGCVGRSRAPEGYRGERRRQHLQKSIDAAQSAAYPGSATAVFVAACITSSQALLQREGILARTGLVGSFSLNRSIGMTRLVAGLIACSQAVS